MSHYAHPNSLASTQWVAEHLHDPEVRLVEIKWGDDETGYSSSHIPNATAWDFGDELSKDFGDPINGDIIDKGEIEALLSRSGVTPNMTVVLYDRFSNLMAAYTFWLLKYYGHQNVKLIDGNIGKWISEGRATESAVPSFPETKYQAQEPNNALRASRDYIENSIGKPNMVIVDARPTEMYSGESDAGAKRAGHIPGAVNMAAMRASGGWLTPTVNEDGTFKPASEIQSIAQDLGITKEKDIVTYCVGGGLSSHAWFVFTQLLGYEKVREYERSWNEWGNLSETPIET